MRVHARTVCRQPVPVVPQMGPSSACSVILAGPLAKTEASAFVRDVRDIACKSTSPNLPPLQFRSERLHMRKWFAASRLRLLDKRRREVLAV